MFNKYLRWSKIIFLKITNNHLFLSKSISRSNLFSKMFSLIMKSSPKTLLSSNLMYKTLCIIKSLYCFYNNNMFNCERF